MARMLNLPLQTVEAALLALAAADLIVATERIVQVLPVPARDAGQPDPAQSKTSPAKRPVPVLKAQPLRHVSEDEIRAYEPEARARIARFYGTREPSASGVWALARSIALKENP